MNDAKIAAIREPLITENNALRARAEKAEARLALHEALADVVRKLCRNAVPQWAPELRAALAKVDASTEKKT